MDGPRVGGGDIHFGASLDAPNLALNPSALRIGHALPTVENFFSTAGGKKIQILWLLK